MDSDSSGADIVELGRERRFRLPEWRPSRGAGLFAAAALVIGLAAGYTAGDRHASSTAALRKSTATTSSGTSPSSATGAAFALTDSPALTQDTGACSVQTGQELQLGVQVTNQSTATITLQTAKAVLPLGELKQLTWQWATCGALPAGLNQELDVLSPGQSTWLSAMFELQIPCPAPAPVQFTVGYLVQDKPATASLPGFADLGEVPFSGC